MGIMKSEAAMKIKFTEIAQKSYTAVKDGAKTAYTATKSGVSKGIQYTKTLTQDTVNFVKTNPKKAGKYAAIALGVGAAIYAVKTAVLKTLQAKKENEVLKEVATIQAEHIGHQQEIIGALKESCADSQEIIDTQHEALDAAHENAK